RVGLGGSSSQGAAHLGRFVWAAGSASDPPHDDDSLTKYRSPRFSNGPAFDIFQHSPDTRVDNGVEPGPSLNPALINMLVMSRGLNPLGNAAAALRTASRKLIGSTNRPTCLPVTLRWPVSIDSAVPLVWVRTIVSMACIAWRMLRSLSCQRIISRSASSMAAFSRSRSPFNPDSNSGVRCRIG